MVYAKVDFALVFVHAAAQKLLVGNVHRNHEPRFKFRLTFREHIGILLGEAVVGFHPNALSELFQYIFKRKSAAQSVAVRISVAEHRNIVHFEKLFAALLHGKLHFCFTPPLKFVLLLILRLFPEEYAEYPHCVQWNRPL